VTLDPFDDPDAACRNPDYEPDWWFAEEGSAEAKRARRICRDECAVVFACLAYAITNEQRHGIWGGLSMSSQSDARARGQHRRRMRRWDE